MPTVTKYYILPQGLLVAILFSAILCPYIRLIKEVPALRPDLALLLIAWGLIIWFQITTGKPTRFHSNPIYKWFLFFGTSILISLLFGILAKGQIFISADLWELVKVVQYYLLFLLVANNIKADHINRHYKYAIIAFFLSALFGFAQYLEIGNINDVITPYYAPTQFEWVRNQGRITGTTANPNEFAGMMVLAFSLALSAAIVFREKGWRLFLWICTAVFSLTIMFTASRTGLICLVITIIIIVLRLSSAKGGFTKRSLRTVFFYP